MGEHEPMCRVPRQAQRDKIVWRLDFWILLVFFATELAYAPDGRTVQAGELERHMGYTPQRLARNMGKLEALGYVRPADTLNPPATYQPGPAWVDLVRWGAPEQTEHKP